MPTWVVPSIAAELWRTTVDQILSLDGEYSTKVDMKKVPPIDGRFVSLGKFNFDESNQWFVMLSNADTDGVVTIDCVQFLPVDEDAKATKKQKGGGDAALADAEDAVESLEKSLETRGIATKRLPTSHAFHSSMMDPVLEPFAALLKKVPLRAPQIPYVSNVTANWISAA